MTSREPYGVPSGRKRQTEKDGEEDEDEEKEEEKKEGGGMSHTKK